MSTSFHWMRNNSNTKYEADQIWVTNKCICILYFLLVQSNFFNIYLNISCFSFESKKVHSDFSFHVRFSYHHLVYVETGIDSRWPSTAKTKPISNWNYHFLIWIDLIPECSSEMRNFHLFPNKFNLSSFFRSRLLSRKNASTQIQTLIADSICNSPSFIRRL